MVLATLVKTSGEINALLYFVSSFNLISQNLRNLLHYSTIRNLLVSCDARVFLLPARVAHLWLWHAQWLLDL